MGKAVDLSVTDSNVVSSLRRTNHLLKAHRFTFLTGSFRRGMVHFSAPSQRRLLNGSQDRSWVMSVIVTRFIGKFPAKHPDCREHSHIREASSTGSPAIAFVHLRVWIDS